MSDQQSAAAGSETKSEKEIQLKHNFNQIERFFRSKQEFIQQCKHVPVEEVLRNAPKYYSFLKLVEQINSFIMKDGKWLDSSLNSEKSHAVTETDAGWTRTDIYVKAPDEEGAKMVIVLGGSKSDVGRLLFDDVSVSTCK